MTIKPSAFRGEEGLGHSPLPSPGSLPERLSQPISAWLAHSSREAMKRSVVVDLVLIIFVFGLLLVPTWLPLTPLLMPIAPVPSRWAGLQETPVW